jgi:hypothetical protein
MKYLTMSGRHRWTSISKRRSQVKRNIVEVNFSYLPNPSIAKRIIRYNNYRLLIWDIFIIVLAFYNSIFIPIEISFESKAFKEIGYLMVDVFVDIFFILDIVVVFHTTYLTNKGEEIFDKNMIAKRYLLGQFIIDFLPVV